MKNIYAIIALLATFCWANSCSEELDPVYVAGNEKSAQMITPQSGKEYVLDKDNKYEILDTFKWGKSEYSIPMGVRYVLEIEKEGGDFKNPVRLSSLTANEISFTVEEMNNALEKLGITPDIQSKIQLRLVSNAYGGEEGNVPLTRFDTLYSTIVELLVTPYEVERAYPENLYMIGADFGNWDWENAGIVEMIPVNGKEGEFWGINYFMAGNGFKWAPKKTWANSFNVLDTNTGFVIDGGDAKVAAEGLYMVHINMKNSEISMEPAKVYGIGDCFGGWTEKLVLFATSGQTLTHTIVTSARLRMYAGSAIATTDWWTREFIIIDGKIEYRANGGEQQAVTANAGQTVTLDFKAGTGSIN